MKRVTSLVLLAGAAALVACASQAPAPPPPGAAPGTALVASPGGAAVAASDASQNTNFKIPSDYKHVVVNGEDRYCHYEDVTGSRVQKNYVCLTLAELEARQENAQQLMNQVDRTGGVLPLGAGSQSGGAGR